MCKEVLEYAISDYKKEILNDNSKIVCQCFNVAEDLIIGLIRQNKLQNIEEITNYTKAAGGCGKCKEDIQKILDIELNK